jgi:hypothetical protein
MFRVTIGLPLDIDGPLRAYVIACATVSAQLRVNKMQLFLLPTNGLHGTFTLAESAAITEIRVYSELNQGTADASRAPSFFDMCVIFLTEITQSGKHRVRCCLA